MGINLLPEGCVVLEVSSIRCHTHEVLHALKQNKSTQNFLNYTYLFSEKQYLLFRAKDEEKGEEVIKNKKKLPGLN